MQKDVFQKSLYGVFVGFLSGLFGGGGGMLAVPVLKKVGSLKDREAHATAIALIAPVCLVGGAIYLFSGVTFRMLVPVSAGFILGGVLGAKLLSALPERPVRIVFGILMLFVGLRMVLG